MRDTIIVPGLSVTDDMFRRAEVALTELNLTPDFLFTWRNFTDPEKWLLVPDADCFGYKAEMVLRRTDKETLKLNIWYGPDLRAGEKPKPHNHPWDFTANVLDGGYDECRYDTSNGGAPAFEEQTHVAGGRNHVPLTTFHEVVRVEPGTLSLMVCGQGAKGKWGYIDPHTGEFVESTPDPDFIAKRAALNPRFR